MARYKDLKYGTTIDSTSIIDASIETADIKDANITLSKLSATGIANDKFLRGDNTWSTIIIPAGTEIVSNVFDGGGGGGGNNTTAFHTAAAVTIDRNKSGVLTFNSSWVAGTSSGGGSSITFAGLRMQLDGSTTGTIHVDTMIVPTGNGNRRGTGFGRMTFTSNSSSRTLNIQAGSTGTHSSPGNVNMTGSWQVVYS